MGKYWFFIIVVVLFTGKIFSQHEDGEPSFEWGKVPIEHLQMTTFAKDSNASAVVLFDYGEVTCDEKFELVFKRHTRIKILTREGYKFGTVNVRYYTNENTQRIKDVEGITLALDEQGKVKEYEFDDDEIFEEKLDEKWEQIKFTLPMLSVGCIIEYQYTIKSESPHFIPDWSFHTTEPVVWSEFRVKTPVVYQFASITQTYFSFHIKSDERLKETFFTGGGPKMFDMNYNRWVMKDLPAMREEPYITTMDDYGSRVLFQLAAVFWPGEMPIKILQTWEEVSEELFSHAQFGKQLDGYSSLQDKAEELTVGITDTLKKIEAIYDFVRNAIVWNERNRPLVENDLDDVLELHKGNSAEINLLLTSLLREIGINANPVLLSTRSNGKIKTLYPLVSQFDYVICRIMSKGKEIFMDATDRERPYHLLPRRALNHSGLMIVEGKPVWLTIEPIGSAKTVTLARCNLKSDGTLFGNFQMKFTDYDAFKMRKELVAKKESEFLSSLMKSETSGFAVDSFTIAKKESVMLPLYVDAYVSTSTYAQALNDFIYVNPMTITRTNENPFQLEHRTFPVDFPYPQSLSYTLSLILPDDYELKEYPKDVSISLFSTDGSYSRKSQLSENVFQVIVQYQLQTTVYRPEHYESLRNFFQRIVSFESEQLVLQRKSESKKIPSEQK